MRDKNKKNGLLKKIRKESVGIKEKRKLTYEGWLKSSQAEKFI